MALRRIVRDRRCRGVDRHDGAAVPAAAGDDRSGILTEVGEVDRSHEAVEPDGPLAIACPGWDHERIAQIDIPVVRRRASAETRCREWAVVATYADVCYPGRESDSLCRYRLWGLSDAIHGSGAARFGYRGHFGHER